MAKLLCKWEPSEPSGRCFLYMDDYPLPEYDAEHTWMLSGVCRDRDPSFFFPSDGIGVEIARKVCATCPVQTDCLEYALSYRIEHGVWGGVSERQRRRILASRKVGAVAAPAFPVDAAS